MIADTKDGSLVSVDSSRHQKWVIFCITQRVSDSLAGTKDRLPTDTKNCFCSSDILASFSPYVWMKFRNLDEAWMFWLAYGGHFVICLGRIY
jgi:hypothetical protein